MRSILSILTLSTTLLFANSGKEIFNQKCSPCHQNYIPQSKLLLNYEFDNSDLNLTAPTLVELSFALKDQVGDRKADKESQLMEIENFLNEYINSPDINKTILPQAVIKHFKTMP
ncbi:MAG TPA: hypothetical protein EYG90_03745, partial [Campylobacterales bacterium]|nr:hypothetical protein [Campylobacterales bacterium]